MRARVAALALVLGLARVVHAADPHDLFVNGKFDAAAAEYERLWQESAKSTDGINAVVAWRAAGHYAHARVMLAAVKKRSPPNGKQASFVCSTQSVNHQSVIARMKPMLPPKMRVCQT